MTSVFELLPTAVLVAATTTKTQPYTDAPDASGLKSIDFQMDIAGNAPSSVTILTSMTRHADDSSWVEAGTLSSFNAGTANNFLQIPASGKPLLRYVRWKIVNSGANNATVSITGQARSA